MNAITSSKAQELLILLGGTPPQELQPMEHVPATTSTHQRGLTTSTEERALQLLGSGIAAENVAAALGVTPSRIAQLLSDEEFSKKVETLRYENLQRHNLRDDHYDRIEDTLLGKLERSISLMFKPQEILRAIQVVNGAKRRGQSAPQQVTNQNTIVNLIMPKTIINKFSTNADNQVIRAGEQELHTMPASNLLKQIEQAAASQAMIQNNPQQYLQIQDSQSCEEIINIEPEEQSQN